MSQYRFVLLAIVLLVPSIARAQQKSPGDRDSEPAGYWETVSAAIEEYQAARYSEAREQFRRAHLLFPNARTLRGLGLAEYELRNYPDAIRYLEQALESRVRPLEGMVRKETETVLQQARGYVGTVHIELEPATARLSVDGQRVEYANDRPLLLPVGDHTIEASATGRFSERRMVKVDGGQKQIVRFKLARSETTSSVARGHMPVNEERPTKMPVYKRWWLWTGIAVVAGGVATAVLLATRRESSEVPLLPPNAPDGAQALDPYPRMPR